MAKSSLSLYQFKYFIQASDSYLQEGHADLEVEQVNIKDLGQDFFAMDNQFVAFLPTYLEGGNELTLVLRF